jgi:hypothetical protein
MPVMGWVRFHRRYGAWPGLAALVLQLVLSFGHIHVGNVHLNGATRGFAAILGATAVATHHVTLADTSKKLPAQNSGDDDDYCAICASIFLTSTSFAAEPPQLPLPAGFERIALTYSTDQGMSAPRLVLFRSRAPPAA